MKHNQIGLVSSLVLLVLLGITDDALAQDKVNESKSSLIPKSNPLFAKGEGFIQRLIKPGQFDYQAILNELGFSEYQLQRTLQTRHNDDYQLHLYFKEVKGKLTGQDVKLFKDYITRIVQRLGYQGESCDASLPVGETINGKHNIYVETFASGCAYGSAERPFSSISQARDAIRELKKSEPNVDNIEVIIGQGNYTLHQGIRFEEQDSGSAATPIVYRAETNHDVIFFGGALLDPLAFTPANEGFTSTLVNADTAQYIVEIDLNKVGIENLSRALGELTPHGWNLEYTTRLPSAMLYSGNSKMALARWPNVDEHSEFLDEKSAAHDITGMVSYSAVIDKGLTQQDANKWSDEFNNGGGTMAVDFDRPSQWHKLSEVHLDGILAYSWEWTYNQIKAFDSETKQLSLKRGELSGIGSNKGSHFYFENVAEELDQAGEFYIDRDLGKLYFYPTEDFASNTTVLSTLAEPMLSIAAAKYISFDGITFDTGRNLAIDVSKSQNINITNCTIQNFSLGGVLLDGINNNVSRCEIANVGGYGVKVAGGTAAKLSKSSGSQVLDTLQQPVEIIAGNNLVTENTIYNFAWDQKSQVPGVSLTGVGNSATYNEIHTAPHFAILMRNTTDNIVAYNYIHDLPNYHKNDGGALYVGIGSAPHLRGNEITNNYFEFIPSNGVYLDNFSSGIKVEHNIFNDVGNNNDTFSGININGGGQNIMQQNFFYNVSRPIKYNKFAANSLFNNYYNKMKGIQTAFNNADVTSTPYVDYAGFIEFLAYSTEDDFHYQSSSALENFSFNNLVLSDERAATTGVIQPDDDRWLAEENALVAALTSELETEYQTISAIFNLNENSTNWRNIVETVTSQLSSTIPAMLAQIDFAEPNPYPQSNYPDVTTWHTDSANEYWTGFNIDGAMLDVMRLPASDNKGGNNASNGKVESWLASVENLKNDDGFVWRFATLSEAEAIASFYNQDSASFLEMNGAWSPKGGMWAAIIPTSVQGNCTHRDGCLFPAYAFTVKADSFTGVSYKQSFGMGTTGGAALLVRERITLDDGGSETNAQNFIVNGDFEVETIEPWNINQGGASLITETVDGNTIAVIQNRDGSHASTVKQSFTGLVAGESYQLAAQVKVVETGYDVGVFIGYRNEGAKKDVATQVGNYQRTTGDWLSFDEEFILPNDAIADKAYRIWIRSTKGEHATTDAVPSIYFDDVTLISNSVEPTDPVEPTEPEIINIAANGDLESGTEGYTLQKSSFEVIFDNERNSTVGYVSNRTVVSSSARLSLTLESTKKYSVSIDAKLVDDNLTAVVGDLDLVLLYFVNGQRTSVELATDELANGWITLSGEITMPADAEITGGKVWVKSDTLNNILFDNLRVETEVVETTNPEPEPEPEFGEADGATEGYGITITQCQADLSHLKPDALYVAAGANSSEGSADGSEASPFTNLSAALSSVATDGVVNQPGLTIYLREGEYHETIDSSLVSSLTGAVDNPVVIEAYPCETVRFTGASNIENLAATNELGEKSQWEQHFGNIYKREITKPVWQLFVDNEQRMVARWPNANFDIPSATNHQSIYSDHVWAEGKLDSAKTRNGIMINNPSYHDLASATDYRGEPLNVDGAIVLANTASFYTYSRMVKAYDAMSSTFTGLFKTMPDDTSVGHVAGSNTFSHEPIKSGYKGKQLSYYLEAKLELLDAENEWHYQVENGKHFVYLWSDTVDGPTAKVTVRDSGYAFNVANWQHVEIKGLDYFASTIKCSPCNNIMIANSNFKHSATSLRVLKEFGDAKSGYGRNQLIELYSATDKRANSGIVFKNNVVTDSDSQSLIIQGGQSVIENNLFERLDITSADTISPHATVMITKMSNQKATFSRNTMDIIGNSTMFVPEGGSLHALYNNMITGGFAQNDGASFQLRKAQQAAANIAYNWAHDSEKYGIRFDAPFDTTNETSGGQFGLIHHNVVWNAKGIMVKGDDHRVYHNTTWNNADIDQRMLVDPNPYYRHERTVTSNNASDSISKDRLVESDTLAGVVGNNFNGLKEPVSLVSQLNDMFNYDFRPLREGALHNAGAIINSPNSYAAYTGDASLPQYQEARLQGSALDLGAYELDSPFYWIPGYKAAKASFAIPRNELVDATAKPVAGDVSLMWRDGYQALSHNLYLAATKASVEAIPSGEITSTVFQGNFIAGEANIYQSELELAPGSYYWRVDVVKADGTIVTGDTWKFIVE